MFLPFFFNNYKYLLCISLILLIVSSILNDFIILTIGIIPFAIVISLILIFKIVTRKGKLIQVSNQHTNYYYIEFVKNKKNYKINLPTYFLGKINNKYILLTYDVINTESIVNPNIKLGSTIIYNVKNRKLINPNDISEVILE